MSVRYSDGDFQDGLYSVDDQTITVELYPVRKHALTLIRDSSGTLELRYSTTGGEEFSLHTDDAELTLHNDEERRFLFDRGFHWTPEAPVNR